MGKPGLPQGTRDFAAAVVHKRNFILNTIRTVFELHGFEPLETPAMENLDTLMGKYGEEGDKLIYRILDSGNPFDKNFLEAFGRFLKDHSDVFNLINKKLDTTKENPYSKPLWEIPSDILIPMFKKLLEDDQYSKFLPQLKNPIAGKALKYDLTIPFARYVAMNAGSINFPFKRYQIQPVWRADRPQRGRYREFTQCDADVVGSTSLINEIELCNIYHRSFVQLGLKEYELRINSRKILSALAEITGGTEKMIDITVAIDKLDKIGIGKVKEELVSKGLAPAHIEAIEKYLSISGSNEEKINAAEQLFGENESGKKGIEELKYLVKHAANTNLIVDLTLARGLNYYTGIIFEVKGPASVKMGSIGGGGRYDDLTGLFGVPNIPGVGISFGIDRIYDVMEELNIFPENIGSSSKAIFFNLGEEEASAAMKLMNELRDSGIGCEIYPEKSKMDKQFKYADKKNIAFAVIIGSEEMKNGTAMVKELKTGTQSSVPFNELINFLNNK